MARTQEERKAETRGRLLDAAADLFARKGFHAVSADAVADAADRTTGALYSHFGGKEGLLLALLTTWATEAAAQVGTALDAANEPGDRVAALWSAYQDRADGGAGPDDAWMLLEHELWLYAARNPEAADALARRYGSARHGMADAFTRWADEAGTDLPLDGSTTGALVLALLLGLDMQRRVDPTAIPDDVAVAGLRRLLGLDPSDPVLMTEQPST